MITQSSSKLEEVVQERPSESTWGVWRKFLKKHICNKKLEATVKLYSWDVDMNHYERLWPFYYSDQYACIYKSYRTHWYSEDHYTYEGHKWIQDDLYSFESSFKRHQLPSDAVPVMVWEERKLGWRVPTAAATIYQKPNPSPSYDFMSLF